jgi:opacity protein-like surface antigen
MNTRSSNSVLRRRLSVSSGIRGIQMAAVISALAVILAPITAAAHPQTRGGFFMGIGLARGSMGVSDASANDARESGWGGGFRLGYAPNPRFALGLENSNWIGVGENSASTLNTFIAAVSVFPAEGLVLRGGAGVGTWAGAGGGLSGEVGTGWTVGAGYEFRVARSFAIGPQLDYSGVSLSGIDTNFFNVGAGMTWYFIPE